MIEIDQINNLRHDIVMLENKLKEITHCSNAILLFLGIDQIKGFFLLIPRVN